MAIGPITSPVTWVGGTVAAASWFQNSQDNINEYVGVKAGTVSVVGLTVDGVGGNVVTPNAGVSRSYWIPAPGMSVSGTWTYTSSQYWTAGGGTGSSIASAAIVLPYKVAPFAATITSVSVRFKPASGTGFTFDIYKVTNLSNTTPPVFASVGSGSYSGTAEQTVTISGLSETMTSDKAYYIQTLNSAPGDKMYAFGVTYTIPIF